MNQTQLEILGGITTLLIIIGGVIITLIICAEKQRKTRNKQFQEIPLGDLSIPQATRKVLPNIDHINKQFGTKY